MEPQHTYVKGQRVIANNAAMKVCGFPKYVNAIGVVAHYPHDYEFISVLVDGRKTAQYWSVTFWRPAT